MRVLDVVDRVVVRVRLRQLEIEVEVLVVAAHHVEEARRVVADFVAQLAQRDELARARRHLRLLAAAIQRHELQEPDLETVPRLPHRDETRAHACQVAVMIGAQDVDQLLEAPLALAEVIGDVGGEIGSRAVRRARPPGPSRRRNRSRGTTARRPSRRRRRFSAAGRARDRSRRPRRGFARRTSGRSARRTLRDRRGCR